MSKKYFINNVDGLLGQQLIRELMKEEEGEQIGPQIMATYSDSERQDVPKGIKKILKRYKPKLMRKKMLEECDTYIYDIKDKSDIDIGIQNMKWTTLEDNKQIIIITDVLSWGGQKQKEVILKKVEEQEEEDNKVENEQDKEEQDKPKEQEEEDNDEEEDEEDDDEDEDNKQKQQQEQIQQQEQTQQQEEEEEEEQIVYQSYREQDYQERKPLDREYYIERKEYEDYLLSIDINNLKITIIASGMQYGYKEQTLLKLVKSAWEQQPKQLEYYKDGDNMIQCIHITDLSRLIIKVCESGSQELKYILAVDNSGYKKQKDIVMAISSGVGNGNVGSCQSMDQLQVDQQYHDYFNMDIDMQCSQIMIGVGGDEGGDTNFEWKCEKGICQNIPIILNEFRKIENHRPLKIHLVSEQNPSLQTTSIMDQISQFYKIPIISIESVFDDLKSEGRFKRDTQLIMDYQQMQSQIKQLIESGSSQDGVLSEEMKVLVRILKWRLSQNDCSNRGYVLYNYPNTIRLMELVMLVQNNKVLAKQEDNKEDNKKKKKEGGDEEEEEEEDNQQAEEQQDEEQEQPKIRLEQYFPETVIVFKKINNDQQLYKPEIEEFYRIHQMDVYVCDSSRRSLHENLENITINIERNGRPNNYLQESTQLTDKHLKYYSEMDQKGVNEREKEKEQQISKQKQIESNKQNVLTEQLEYIENNEMNNVDGNFRQYLIQNIIPQMQEALIEVNEMRPKDPIDFLAQILYDKSYEM